MPSPLSGPDVPKKKKKTDPSLLKAAPAEEAATTVVKEKDTAATSAQASPTPPPADAAAEKAEAVSAPSDVSTANAPKAIVVTPEMEKEDAPQEQEQEQPQEKRGFLGQLWDKATGEVKERYDREKERRDTWYGKSLESQRKSKSLKEVDEALLDQENYFRNNFAGSAPEARRDLMVSSSVDLYLAHATGKPLPQDVAARNQLRDDIAQRDFGGEGVKDDKAFHARLVKGATRRKQQGEIFSQVVIHARASAIYDLVGTKGALIKNAQGNMIPGERLANPLSFASFRQKVSTQPGYSPEMDKALLEAWTAAAKVARNTGILPYKTTFERQWKNTQQWGPERVMRMLLDPKGDFQTLVNTGIERGKREEKGDGGEQQATPMSEMMKTIKTLGYYPSYTSATTSAWYKDLRRAKDGKWKTAPLVPISKDNDWRDKAVLTANVTHQRWAELTELDGPLAQRVEEIQKEWNLTDRQVTVLWRDMGNLHREWDKDEGPFRTLSNGQIIPNPLSDQWLDTKSIRHQIIGSSASEESKKETLLLLSRYQDEIASNKLEGYRLSFGVTNEIVLGAKIPTPDEWAEQQGREHEINEPEFIQEYEHKVLYTAGVGKFVLHGWAASGVKGLNKVANIGTGIAGLFGSESATAYGVELHEANRIIANGQFDMGAAGMLIEEAPSLIIQLAVTRGIGMGAGAGARAVGATGTWGGRAVKLTAITAAAVTAGGQSASSTFLQSRSEGRSDKEAREDAINAGLVTAIITGTFSLAGAGGPERFATNVAGKTSNAMQTALAKVPGATRLQNVTVGQLVKALPKGQARDAIKRFAKATIQAGAEGTEEGLDTLVNTIISADPDTNLASLWSEVSDAFMAGVLLGAGAEGVDITATLAKHGASADVIGNEYRYRDRPDTPQEQSSPAADAPPANDTGTNEAPPADAPANAEQNTAAPAEGVSPGTAAPDGQAPTAEGATTETKDAPEEQQPASSPAASGLTSAPPSGARNQDTPAGQPAQDGTVPAAPGMELPNGSTVVAESSDITGEQKPLPKNEGYYAGNPPSAGNDSPKDSASIKERVMATRPPDADTSPVPTDIKAAYTTKTEGWRHKIIEWARSVLPGEVTSKALGKVEIGKKKIRGAFGHGRGPLKILSIPYIPEMLQNGIPFHSAPQADGSIMHNLAHRIRFDGEDYVAILAIEELRGKRFYNHEFTEIKKLEELSHDQAAALDTAHPTPQTARTVLSNIWKVNPAGAEASTERNNSSAGSGNKTAANATPAGETEEAQAAQRLGAERTPPNTSQPGPGGNVTDPLHPIKDASGAPANVSDPSPVKNEPGLPEESGAGTEAPGASSKSGPTTNISDSPGQSNRKSPANPETLAKVAIEREAAATIVNNARAGGMDDASAHRHAAQTAPAAAAATTLAEDLADHLPQTRRAAGDIAHALTRDASTPPPEPDHLPSRLAPSLAEDIPAVPWTRADRSGILDGEWTSDPATLQDLLPKVTNATAPDATAAKRANAFRSLTDQELTALGVPPQDIPALRESLDGTDFNAIRAGMAALRKLTPHSPDARNAASDLAETAASNRATVPGGDTTIQRLPNGRYRVHDPATGEEIGQAPNRSAAVRMAQLAAEHSNPPADAGDGDSASNNSSSPADVSTDTASADLAADSMTGDPTDGTATDDASLLKITDSAGNASDPSMLSDPAALVGSDSASAPVAPADPNATSNPTPDLADAATNGSTIDSDPPAAPKIYKGETVDAAWYQRKAKEATRYPSSPRVILGKYSPTGTSYEKVAEALKNSYFQLDDWDDLASVLTTPDLMWPINEAFLDQQLSEGKEIYFSHDPDKADGYFIREVKFLKGWLHGTDYSFEKEGDLYKLVRK